MKKFLAFVLILVCVSSFIACYNSNDTAQTISFHNRIFNKSDLSEETIKWLEWYNQLSEPEMLSISYIPPDLYELLCYNNAEDIPAEAE